MSFGLNHFANQYQKNEELADYQNLLDNANKSEIGHMASVEIGWKLSEKLKLTSGVEFINAQTQFDLVQTWDTLIYLNNIPGAELINAEAERTVKHHNTQKYVIIPLLIWFSNQSKKISVGINAGLGINYLVSQKGKSIRLYEWRLNEGETPLFFDLLRQKTR
jgi:hypothetical protein